MIRHLCLACVLLAGCSRPGPPRPEGDEERVRSHVLSQAAEPATVQFESWGPHSRGELHALAVRVRRKTNAEHWPQFVLWPLDACESAPTILRARYRQGGAVHDSLFLIDSAGEVTEAPNQFGDEWLARWRRELEDMLAAPPRPQGNPPVVRPETLPPPPPSLPPPPVPDVGNPRG